MKKKALLLSTALSIILCSCSSGLNSSATTESGTIINDNTSQEESALSKIGNVIEEATEEEATKLTKGTASTLSDGSNEAEITVKNVSFENEIHSTSDNQFAQYYTDQDGESWLLVKVDLKNTSGDAISDSFFKSIEATFDDKYNYTMFQIDPESAILSQFWSLQPLKTKEIYFAQSVPDEVKNSNCIIKFTVGENIYQY